MRNVDVGFSGFSDFGGGFFRLGFYYILGIYLGLEDIGGFLGEYLCVFEFKVELVIFLEDRFLVFIWDFDLLFGICFFKLFLNYIIL